MKSIRVLIQSIATYLRELDERSRRRMSHDQERQAGAADERTARREELELEIALFVQSLPAWVLDPERFRDPAAAAASIDPTEVIPPEDGTPGADWVVAADVQLELSQSRWRRLLPGRRTRPDEWIAARPARGRTRESLPAGTHLRLVGRAPAAWPRREDDATLALEDAPAADRGLVLEVLEGPAAGRLVRISGLSRWPSVPALLAASMIAPAGHRIVDWPSAASDVLARLERRAAAAERSAREVAYEERWAWRHDLVGRPVGSPVAKPVRVRRDRSEEDGTRK
jgi:hypothetical protein